MNKYVVISTNDNPDYYQYIPFVCKAWNNLGWRVICFTRERNINLDHLQDGYNHFYQLKGESKKVSMRKDARGRPLIQDGMLFTETPQGEEIKLTIDSDLQYFVETELKQALQKHEAEAAYAVVLDAKTSAIRAIASLPSFNPNDASKVSPGARLDLS